MHTIGLYQGTKCIDFMHVEKNISNPIFYRPRTPPIVAKLLSVGIVQAYQFVFCYGNTGSLIHSPSPDHKFCCHDSRLLSFHDVTIELFLCRCLSLSIKVKSVLSHIAQQAHNLQPVVNDFFFLSLSLLVLCCREHKSVLDLREVGPEMQACHSSVLEQKIVCVCMCWWASCVIVIVQVNLQHCAQLIPSQHMGLNMVYTPVGYRHGKIIGLLILRGRQRWATPMVF